MRRPIILLVLAVGLALVASGCITYNVTKQTTGGDRPSGDFVVEIACDNGDPGQTEELTFPGDEEFPQTIQSGEFDFFLGPGSCNIRETESANASSTTIRCVEPPEDITCTPQPDGSLDVSGQFTDPTFYIVDIEVTNDLTPPTTIPDPAPIVIEAEPRFTA